MRKLADIRGEEALDILADIIEPFSRLAEDEEFVRYVRNGNKIKAASCGIRNHKKDILLILALLNGEDPETYSPGIIELPVMLVSLINDPDLALLFPSAETVTSSGPATVNTEAIEKK